MTTGASPFHISDEGIRRSQVDSNYASFRHAYLLSSKGLGYVANQVVDIAPAIEQGHHLLLRC